MRAIVNSRRDEKEEQRRLEAECKRLAEEEEERIRRTKRKQMEQVDTSSVAPDADLMSDLRKRVQTLSNDGDEDTDSSNKDDNMRHTPIPDRGTGSMLLDRPDDESDSDAQASSAESMEQPANPDELEMLKRMWNMSPPDKE